MGQTPLYNLLYPEGTQANNVPLDMFKLAKAVEDSLSMLQQEREKSFPFGVAYPYFFPGPPPEDTLFLAGQTVNAAAYPVFAFKYFGVTTGNIVMPDWRGCGPKGLADTSLTPGSTTGQDKVNLNSNQNGPHSHVFAGNSHTHPAEQDPHRHGVADDYGLRFIVTADNTGLRLAAPGAANGQALANTQMSDERPRVSISAVTATGTVQNSGAGADVPTVPKSKLVNWFTRVK